MKKVKVMLMSTLVVVAVGGALAFKAQSFSPDTWHCGTATNSCPNVPDQNVTTVGASETNHRTGTDIFCTNSGLTTIGCTYALNE